MRKLREMPRDQHPFNFVRRERTMDELNDAERRFRDLQHRGRHPHAASLADEAIKARRAIQKLWDAMRAVEESEKDVAG